MPVRVIESNQNARLKELRRALAQPGRANDGRAGIEGQKLIEEALCSGLAVPCIFLAKESQRLLEGLVLPPETEILLLPGKLLESALATETPQPIAALVERPDWTWDNVLGSRRRITPLVLVLAGLQDPGNLGTIVRSAEAFGASGIVSLPGTVSEWNPKAVRASTGSIFRVPLIAISERECLEQLRAASVKILATTVRAAQPADLLDMTGPTAFVIGNEGNGVADDLISKADAKITIPCPGPVESLNAAVAASVLLYEAAQQRSGLSGGPSDHRGARR